MGEVHKIGAAARQSLLMLGQQHSEKLQTESRVSDLCPVEGFPQTDDEARALSAWASSLPAKPAPATPNEIARHLEYLAAALPIRKSDEDAAQKRFAVYARMLGGFCNEALAHMSLRALTELDWFPSPRQCIAYATEHEPVTKRDKAETMCRNYWQGRYEGWLASIAAGDAGQDHIDAVPRHWRMMAMERGYLRLLDDGSFIIRRASHPDQAAAT